MHKYENKSSETHLTMRQARIIPCIFFKKIKNTSKPPIPIELGLKFVKSKYFEQSKKNAIFLEKEISSVIAAWHYFVHISCNFRLDDCGEKYQFLEREKCKYKRIRIGIKYVSKSKRGNLCELNSFNFWHTCYLVSGQHGMWILNCSETINTMNQWHKHICCGNISYNSVSSYLCSATH